jgi:outer membrane protein TolC
MRIKALLLLSLSWTLPTPCLAEEATSLTLQQCIEMALEKNPLILSSAGYYRASLARIKQATALPQPVFSYDSDLQPSFFDFANSGESYTGITFGIPFPTKLKTSGDIARKESEAVSADVELLKLEIIYSVKEAFYGLLLAQEKLSYAENDLELAREFLEDTELKLEAGDVARVEALRARVEAAGAENQVREERNGVRVARAVLNFHLARSEYEPLEIEGQLRSPPMELDLESLKQTALTYRPEIAAAQLSLEREKLIRGLGVQSYLPDLELGIARHRVDGDPMPKTWDVTFAMPVPLFFWQPKQGEIAEADANIEALSREAEHLRNFISLEVEEAYRDALTASNQIELFETDILTQAEEVHNMFLFSYQEGEIGGIELIAARRTLLEARRAYADALFGYSVALAALQKAIGQGAGGN